MSLSTVILEGNRRKVTATFENEAAAPTDPSTVKFFIRNPKTDELTTRDFAVPADSVVKEDTGVYSIEVAFPDNGDWTIGVEGTGTCEAYGELAIVVQNAVARA